MPTIRQMQRLWEAEFRFPWMRRDYVPPPVNNNAPFSGKVIGKISIDPETLRMVVKLNKTKNHHRRKKKRK